MAIDGSEISDYALNLAIHIGEAMQSELGLIYVHAPSVAPPVATPMYDPLSAGPLLTPMPEWQTPQGGVGSRTSSKDGEFLEQRKKHVEESGLLCVTSSVESDNVPGEIMKVASEQGYTLIVLGSRGLSGFKSLILGSVSKKVAKEAKTSVLIVKEKVDGLPKILVGYDGSEESKRALYAAAELGLRFNGKVDPFGVVSIPVAAEGAVMPDGIDKWESEMTDEIRKAIAILKERGITKCEGKTTDSADVTKGIIEEATRGSYDLIAVGSKGYGRLRSFFLGSVASSVADSAKTNVLIVR